MKFLPVLFCGIIYGTAALSTQDDTLEKSMARGKIIFDETCITCHMGKGEGVAGAFPPLAKSDYLLKTPEKAIQAIKFGLKGKIQVNGVSYDSMMPSPGLSDDEVADVMNFIKNSWGNSAGKKMITAKMVEAIKE